MKKIFLFCIITVFLSGCMSAPSRRYYQIYLSLEEESASRLFDKVLLVDRVDVDDLYDDYRIVYRESPYQLNFYSYEFWADKPAKLVQGAVIHYLLGKEMFHKVIKELSKGDPDLVLRSRIHTIEEVDTETSWYARLAMEMEISDFKSGESILFHQFDRKVSLSDKNVAQVPIALSRILKEELGKVISDLASKIR
ncbi:MAG: membrane integrity-associated transporter subunit PqiC [Candidatus Aminicenantes bacterium]|nr:membrane integrity-associated transporter subunit PqiC [Candidatus Aminicenantes bacterium]